MFKHPITQLVLIVAFTLVSFEDIISQQVEWRCQVALYNRKSVNESGFVIDPIRIGVLFIGGAYDSYFTADGGTTWKHIFNLQMAFHDAQCEWQCDWNGRWYYTGNRFSIVSHTFATDDQGITFYSVSDSTKVPFDRSPRRVRPLLVYPDALQVHYGNAPDTVDRGLYSTCDAGATWKRSPLPPDVYLPNKGELIRARTVRYPDSAGRITEVDLCEGTITSTGVMGADLYYDMGNGTRIVVEQTYPKRGIRIYEAGDTIPTIIKGFHDPLGDLVVPVYITNHTRIHDSVAFFFTAEGVTGVWTTSRGFRFVDTPIATSESQRLMDVGYFNGRLLARTAAFNEGRNREQRWLMVDLSTGVVGVHHRQSSNDFPSSVMPTSFTPGKQLCSIQRIVPLTDSLWLMAPKSGELLRTTNAGHSWEYVVDLPIDDQWGQAWVSMKSIHLLGDDEVALATQAGRLLYSDGHSKFELAHLGPFRHRFIDTINRGGRWSLIDEDNIGQFHLRYGPSSVLRVGDRLWTTGDVLASYSTESREFDTVLNVRIRKLKRLSGDTIIASMDSVYITSDAGKSWRCVSGSMPAVEGAFDTLRASIGDAIITKSGVLVAGLRGWKLKDKKGEFKDSIPGGFLTSEDLGKTWKRPMTETGHDGYITSLCQLSSGTLLAMGTDMRHSPITSIFGNDTSHNVVTNITYYSASHGHIYRSIDEGRTWQVAKQFDSLAYFLWDDCSIHALEGGRALAFHPVYGSFYSYDEGITWTRFEPFVEPTAVHEVAVDKQWYHLATDRGYARIPLSEIVSVSEPTRPDVKPGRLTVQVDSDGTLHLQSPSPLQYISLYTLHGQFIQGAVPDAVSTATVVDAGVSSALYRSTLPLPALSPGVYVVVATTATGQPIGVDTPMTS
jgi:hypothetical protein